MRSIIAVTAAVVFWGSSFIATKIAGACFTPLLLCLVRFAVSSLLFGVFCLGGWRPARPKRRDAFYIAVTSLTGITVYYALETIGVQLTTAGNASLISASYPAITALVGILFYRERPSGRILAGILIAICGIFLLNDWSSLGLSEGGAGNMMLLADGFLWAYYNYTMQKISSDMDPISISCRQIWIGTAAFVPLVWLEKPVFTGADLSAWLAVAYLSVCCTVAALLLYNRGIRQIPASLAASLMNLIPVVGVLLSVLVLSEQITLKQMTGGAVILLGVWISASRSKRKQAENDTMDNR